MSQRITTWRYTLFSIFLLNECETKLLTDLVSSFRVIHRWWSQHSKISLQRPLLEPRSLCQSHGSHRMQQSWRKGPNHLHRSLQPSKKPLHPWSLQSHCPSTIFLAALWTRSYSRSTTSMTSQPSSRTTTTYRKKHHRAHLLPVRSLQLKMVSQRRDDNWRHINFDVGHIMGILWLVCSGWGCAKQPEVDTRRNHQSNPPEGVAPGDTSTTGNCQEIREQVSWGKLSYWHPCIISFKNFPANLSFKWMCFLVGFDRVNNEAAEHTGVPKAEVERHGGLHR